jgi:hypothetical protein
VTLPVPAARTGLRPGEWNDVEVLLDANIVRLLVNNGGPSGVAEDDAGAFGNIALYVGGTGEVRFRDVAYKDLAIKTRAAERVSNRFRMQQLTDFYYGWGASVADFNRDGTLDIVSGPHIFFGPDDSRRRQIYLATTTNPSTQFTSDCWMQFSADFTGDGWPDVISASFSGVNSGVTLYVNSKGESRRWASHRVVPSQPDGDCGAAGSRSRRRTGARLRRAGNHSVRGRIRRIRQVRGSCAQSPNLAMPRRTGSLRATSTGTAASTS